MHLSRPSDSNPIKPTYQTRRELRTCITTISTAQNHSNPKSRVTQSCLTLCNPMDNSPPESSWGFSRQEYWGGLSCPPPGDLPNPGIEPRSPALQVDYLPSEPPGKPIFPP